MDVRVKSSLSAEDAYRLVLSGLISEGIQITQRTTRPYYIEGEHIRTERGAIHVQKLHVVIEDDGAGVRVTVNGQPDAYRIARRVAKTLA